MKHSFGVFYSLHDSFKIKPLLTTLNNCHGKCHLIMKKRENTFKFDNFPLYIKVVYIYFCYFQILIQLHYVTVYNIISS